MASHFDSSGHPNGWSSRAGFFGVYLAMTVVLALVFLAMPMTFRRFPRSVVSLPRRDYWLAPERVEATSRFIESRMLLFGIVTLVFEILVLQLAISANLGDEPRLPSAPTYLMLVGYFAFTGIWLYRFITHFTRRPV